MLVALQLVGVAVVPLKVTVLVPWLDPKFVPVMVTIVPAGPEIGDRPLMLGITPFGSLLVESICGVCDDVPPHPVRKKRGSAIIKQMRIKLSFPLQISRRHALMGCSPQDLGWSLWLLQPQTTWALRSKHPQGTGFEKKDDTVQGESFRQYHDSGANTSMFHLTRAVPLRLVVRETR